MKHDQSDNNSITNFLDLEDEHLGPEGSTLELYWYLKGQASRGVPGAEAQAEKFREMAEAEIRSNAELAIKALTFHNQDSLLRWLQGDPDAYRMAMADATYREMLERSWATGGDVPPDSVALGFGVRGLI